MGDEGPMLLAALEYARAGVRVLPLHTPEGTNGGCSCGYGADCPQGAGKHPRITKWQMRATTDERVIRSWWTRWPDANIGGAMGEGSGAVIADLDHGQAGVDEWKQYVTGTDDVAYPTARTGSGGYHLWMGHPGYLVRDRVQRTKRWTFEHIDIRGDGGYVVLPPSLHKSGSRYEWVSESIGEWREHGYTIPPIPLFLLEPIQAAEAARERPEQRTGEIAEFDVIIADRILATFIERVVTDKEPRNNTGFELACQLRDAGVPYGQALARMSFYQREVEHAKPEPYTWDEAKGSLDSAYGAPARDPAYGAGSGSFMVADGDSDDAGEGTGKKGKKPSKPRPFLTYELNNTGNGRRLVDAHGDEIRYVWKGVDSKDGYWLIWKGDQGVWRSNGGELQEWMKDICVDVLRESREQADPNIRRQMELWSVSGGHMRHLQDSIRAARSDERIRVYPSQLDADPLLLNVQNGTLELDVTVGKATFREHRAEDLLTKQWAAPYIAGATHELLDEFLDLFYPEPERRTYFQEALGYSLTGLPKRRIEQLLGPTHSGKSQTLTMLEKHAGDYGGSLSYQSLMYDKHSGGDRPRGDLHGIRSKRIVCIAEIPEGIQLDEATLKTITSGGDSPKFRDMFEKGGGTSEPFVCTLWMSGNKPYGPRAGDDAAYERVDIIRCDHQVPETDRDDFRKMQTEDPTVTGPAFLALGVLGFERLYREYGGRLTPPDSIRAAKDETRDLLDPWNGIIEQTVVFTGDTEDAVVKSELWEWAKILRETEDGKSRFTSRDKFDFEDAMLRRGGKSLRSTVVFGNRESWRGVAWIAAPANASLRESIPNEP